MNKAMDSKRFSSALLWCVDEYKDDFRKSSGAPSLHHPLGVCDLVMGAGGDEDTATVQSIDEQLNHEQWAIFNDACGLMKTLHNIG